MIGHLLKFSVSDRALAKHRRRQQGRRSETEVGVGILVEHRILPLLDIVLARGLQRIAIAEIILARAAARYVPDLAGDERIEKRRSLRREIGNVDRQIRLVGGRRHGYLLRACGVPCHPRSRA